MGRFVPVLWTFAVALALLLCVAALPTPRQALYLNVAMIHTTSWAVENQPVTQLRFVSARRALAAWEEVREVLRPRQARYVPYLQADFQRAKHWKEAEQVSLLYDAGQQSLASGDYRQAAALFQTVLERDPHYVEAYISLLRTLRAMEEMEAAQAVQADLLALEPPRRLGEQTPERIWQEVERVQMWPGWFLLGFDVRNAWEMARAPTLEMVFYWQHADSAPTSAQLTVSSEGNWQVVALGDRVWQIGTVPNLAPNPGFEQRVEQGLRCPAGWPREKYSTSSEQIIDQVWADRAGEPTLAVRLNNLTGPSGLVSRRIPVGSSDTVYLQAAWLRTEPGARPCLGRQWFPNPSGSGPWYSYTVCNIPLPEGWTYMASITRPYDSSVMEVELWMLNLGRSAAFFDDLLFVPLHRPVVAGSD